MLSAVLCSNWLLLDIFQWEMKNSLLHVLSHAYALAHTHKSMHTEFTLLEFTV